MLNKVKNIEKTRKFQIETFRDIKKFGCETLKSAIETAKIIKKTKVFNKTRIIVSSYLPMPPGYCKKWNEKYKIEKSF
jgi:hypothetical protein